MSTHISTDITKLETSAQQEQGGSELAKCTLCTASYTDGRELAGHVKRNHNLYACEICLETFKSLRDVIKHQPIHRNSDGTYSCDKCGERFQTRQQLRHHLMNGLANDNEFKCWTCHEEFSDKQTFVEHEITPSSEVPLEVKTEVSTETFDVAENCVLCAIGFSTEQELKEHIQESHKCDTHDKPVVILPEKEEMEIVDHL